jgi:predicted TIM-barrel fold metal-dependent hydrolase
MSDTRSKSITGIDSHAHVFSRDLHLIGARRYTPEYDATLGQYLEHLQTHGLSHGVLVQPSFLGTDNSYLLAALKQRRSSCAVWWCWSQASVVLP